MNKDLFLSMGPVFPEVNLWKRGYFFTKVFAFCFCCLVFLPVFSFAQNDLNLGTIENMKKNYHSIREIAPQRIPIKDAYFLRFPELGATYNPLFPTTRKKIHCSNYQLINSNLSYLGFSISTHRATVKLKGRVGTFYGIWKGETCTSLLEYVVKKEGDYLLVTGKLYKCFSTS